MKSDAAVSQTRPNLPYLQNWFEGETLYSWAAHFHELQGRVSSTKTGVLLFGQDDASRRYSTLSGLAHFVQVTRGQLGNLAEIIMLRTPLAEVRPFVPSKDWRRIISTLSEFGAYEGMTPVNGLLTRGLMMRSRPRYCIECAKAELAEFGTSYWHRGYQFQCSFACAKHRIALTHPRQCGKRWRLPHHDRPFYGSESMPERILAQALLLTRLSEVCSQSETVDFSAFADATIMQLMTVDVATVVPRKCGDALSVWFSQTVSSQVIKAFYPENSDLRNGKWIVRLLRTRRSANPLHWLLLWGALLEELPEESGVALFRNAVSKRCIDFLFPGEHAEYSRNMLYKFLRPRQCQSGRTREFHVSR